MTKRPYSYPTFLRNLAKYLNFDNTGQKIRDFQKFETGWHYKEGLPFSQNAISEALDLHFQILTAGFNETDAFPGLSGEIQVTAYWEDDYFEFTREANGLWTFVHEHVDDRLCKEKGLSLGGVIDIAVNLSQKICNMSESCRGNSGIPESADFRVLPSDPPVTEVEYPSSNVPAFTKSQVLLSVPTLEGITIESLGNRLYSGYFPTKSSPQAPTSKKRFPKQEMSVIAT